MRAREFDVTVNDPDMAHAHRYRLTAPGHEAARLEAARRAIRDDPVGAVPKGDDEAVARVIAAELTVAFPINELEVHDD